jgi:cytochrome b
MTSTEPTSRALAPEQAPGEAKAPLVWDLPVRIFHWCLVASILAAFVTNRLGVKYFQAHAIAGYVVLVLTSFRIVWGIVGTRHARFWNFLRGPSAIFAYARKIFTGSWPRYTGHNPAGGVMVLVLLFSSFAQAATGLFANDEIFNAGPLYGYVAKEVSVVFTSFHRRFFYVILIAAIAPHVLAVIAHKIFKGENLVAAMVTGRKANAPHGEAISSSKLWLAVPLVIGLIALLYWVIVTAPPAALDAEF